MSDFGPARHPRARTGRCTTTARQEAHVTLGGPPDVADDGPVSLDDPPPPWYRPLARRRARAAVEAARRDPRACPLVVDAYDPLHPTYRQIRPDTDAFGGSWLRYDLRDGRPRIQKIRALTDPPRSGLGSRMVERLLDEYGGPGEYESSDVTGDDARAFWRAMRDRHGIVLVKPNGHPVTLDGFRVGWTGEPV